MQDKLLTDKVLERLLRDDKSALEELFNYYYPRLFNFSRSFLKIEDGIDDILQEVFIRIWQNRKKINRHETFNSYLFTITKNLLINELKSRMRDERTKEIVFRNSVAEEYQIAEKIELNELKLKISSIVENLPDKQREVFLLSRVEGLSHKDIAKRLNIKEKTVEYHIHHTLVVLKKKLINFGSLGMLYFYLFLK